VYFKRAGFLMENIEKMAIKRGKWVEGDKLTIEGLQRKHCY